MVYGLIGALVLAACTAGAATAGPDTSATVAPTSAPVPTTEPTTTTTERPDPTFYFATLPPGSELPDDAQCAEQVLIDDWDEFRPENAEANAVVGVPEPQDGVELAIDGADEFWNAELAPRITGNFSGTTEQILRWGACKWGFDEEVTRARAVTESSWLMTTAGDSTEDPELCSLIELDAPCAQSYGLLQVKGTVHTGTYPLSSQSSAFGVDYAMAWLRACYEGSFTWLGEENPDYEPGDEFGCVGAWFSGNWLDEPAKTYIDEVRGHLANRTWFDYQP